MCTKSIVRRQLGRHLNGEIPSQAPRDIDIRQLPFLEVGLCRQLGALARDVGTLGIGLRADRHVLARRHRHGTCH